VAGTYTWSAAYSGDANNKVASETGSATNGEQTVVSAASPTIVTTASPAVTLPTGPSGTVTLSDSAVLSGGYYPTGSITFTLSGPDGFSYSQTDPVSGNGTYMASDTLPTTGTVAGTYTWSAAYSGDANNKVASETGSATNGEQTVVSPASPTIVTTASPAVTLPTGPPGTVTLSDSAVLSGGYYPTGSITFTVSGPGGFSYSQTDMVSSGNSTYTASDTLPTTGTVTGTYTWTAHYSGDSNNNTANDQGGTAEQTVVSPAQVAAPIVQNLQRFGFHAQPTIYVLTFSTALDPTPAQDVRNYRLTPIFGRRLGPDIPITAAIYDPVAHTVTLQPAVRVYLFGHYRLVVNGSTPTGVAGATGLLLDGNGTGEPGTDFVRTFGKKILAGPNFPDPTAGRVAHHRSLPKTPHVVLHLQTTSSAASTTHALTVSSVDAVLGTVVVPKKGMVQKRPFSGNTQGNLRGQVR